MKPQARQGTSRITTREIKQQVRSQRGKCGNKFKLKTTSRTTTATTTAPLEGCSRGEEEEAEKEKNVAEVANLCQNENKTTRTSTRTRTTMKASQEAEEPNRSAKKSHTCRLYRPIKLEPLKQSCNLNLNSNSEADENANLKTSSCYLKRKNDNKWPFSATASCLIVFATLLVTCYAHLSHQPTTSAQFRSPNERHLSSSTSKAANGDQEVQVLEAPTLGIAPKLLDSRLANEVVVRRSATKVGAGVDQFAAHELKLKRPTRSASTGLPLAPPSGRASPTKKAHIASSATSNSTANITRNRQQQQQVERIDERPSQLPAVLVGSRALGIKNVTMQNGQQAILHCLVEPGENGQIPSISWFRGTGELQLLSYDTTMIIQDERFVVQRGMNHENDFALLIRDLNRTTDAGLYQCQTSDDTTPQLQSYQLNIVEPQVNIIGSPDLALKLGDTLNLTCVISQTSDQMQFVFWWRDGQVINYEKRAKIVLSKFASRSDAIASNLVIAHSQATDSGNYTCAPTGAKATSIYVHILEASDKRLIMFQNDDNQHLYSTASSQQTNSALSTHMVRLSRGKMYAFLVGLFILATWFQLVAQLQTAISLFLLAIIGFLLSYTTHDTHKQQPKRPKRDLELELEGAADLGKLSGVNEDGEQVEECHDPLLTSAQTAIHLLRALTHSSASSSCSTSGDSLNLTRELDERHSDQHSSANSAGSSFADKTKATKFKQAPVSEISQTSESNSQRQANWKPQTSPSGSSSTSTGYQSDSIGRVNLLSSRKGPMTPPLESPTLLLEEADEQELEMIELLRNQPSAMRLIMEQLRCHSSLASQCDHRLLLARRRPCADDPEPQINQVNERADKNNREHKSSTRSLDCGSSCASKWPLLTQTNNNKQNHNRTWTDEQQQPLYSVPAASRNEAPSSGQLGNQD